MKIPYNKNTYSKIDMQLILLKVVKSFNFVATHYFSFFEDNVEMTNNSGLTCYLLNREHMVEFRLTFKSTESKNINQIRIDKLEYKKRSGFKEQLVNSETNLLW